MIIQVISGFGGVSEVVPVGQTKKDIYFKLRGQSNAAGRAETDDLPEEMKQDSFWDRIWIFNDSVRAWRRYYPEGSRARTSTGQFGVEAILAYKLRDYYNDGRKILIDKYGVGDTSLGVDPLDSDWNISTNELWLNGKNMFTEAMYYSRVEFFNPDYKLFVWWQGENDTNDTDMTNAYQQNFRDIFDDEKTFVGKSILHYVDIELSDDNGPGYPTINTSKATNVAYYGDANYIPVNDFNQGIHATAAQMEIVGQRIFDQIKDLWK